MERILKGRRNSLNLVISFKEPVFCLVLRKQSTYENPIIAELPCFQTAFENIIFSEDNFLKATIEERILNTNNCLNGKSINNIYFIGEV